MDRQRQRSAIALDSLVRPRREPDTGVALGKQDGHLCVVTRADDAELRRSLVKHGGGGVEVAHHVVLLPQRRARQRQEAVGRERVDAARLHGDVARRRDSDACENEQWRSTESHGSVLGIFLP